MANTNTDLTEEDAADLQFPKVAENTPSNFNFSIGHSEIQTTCSNCFNELAVPYIMCVPCNKPICTFCFSNGAEFLNHKSDHEYKVFREDFVLFENSDWTAKEEMTLLNSLLRYGNWNLVAQDLPKRNVKEIKEHYNYFYLEGHGSPFIPRIKETRASVFPEYVVPYRFKLDNIEDPPRFSPNSVGYSFLAGYNPARSDFECEYDAGAEDLLANLKCLDPAHPHYEVLLALQCGIINAYNQRLKQRQRWKRIMRDHGLILVRKCNSWLTRYENTITRPVYMKLIRFMQLCKPEKFEYLMEGLHRVGELRMNIVRLCNYRSKGITTLRGAKLYRDLQKKHTEYRKELKEFQKSSNYNWKHVVQNMPTAAQIFANKKKTGFSPLDIIGLPGYETLTAKERDLCSTIRLVPGNYFDLKNILIAENKKLGHLKLQTARRLLKIDVNKTRKLFDFLAEEGYITKM